MYEKCVNFPNQPLPGIVYNRLQEDYKRYLLCGGMPEAL